MLEVDCPRNTEVPAPKIVRTMGCGGPSKCKNIHVVAETGDTQRLKELLDTPGIDINALDPSKGISALAIACYAGRVDCALLLVAKEGIDVNIGNTSPIFLCCQQGSVRIVQALLDVEGINLNAPAGAIKQPPISIAAARGHVDVVEALCSQKAIKKGIDINAMDENGETALFGPAQFGGEKSEKIVKLIIEMEGVDVNHVSKNGATSLYHASNGHVEIARMLLAKGAVASINVADRKFGMTALHRAAIYGSQKHNGAPLVKMLLGVEGIEVNKKSTSGRTALTFAMSGEDCADKEEMVAALEAAGAAR